MSNSSVFDGLNQEPGTSIKLFTIGFSKKTAQEFFDILKINRVKKLIDIRRNNISQLAGFTKKKDLEYFLKTIANIEYSHVLEFSPTSEMLKDYQKKKLTWEKYEILYNSLIQEAGYLEKLNGQYFENACFLCSESTSDFCHRRLLADLVLSSFNKNKWGVTYENNNGVYGHGAMHAFLIQREKLLAEASASGARIYLPEPIRADITMEIVHL